MAHHLQSARHGSDEEAIEAYRENAHLETEEAFQVLLALLKRPNFPFLDNVIYILMTKWPKERVLLSVLALESAPDSYQGNIGTSLGISHGYRHFAIIDLFAALFHPNWVVRANAVTLIADFMERRFPFDRIYDYYWPWIPTDALVNLLADPYPQVQQPAATALIILRDQRLIPVLVTWLIHDDLDLRDLALKYLLRFGEVALPAIKDFLPASPTYHQWMIGLLIKEIEGGEAIAQKRKSFYGSTEEKNAALYKKPFEPYIHNTYLKLNEPWSLIRYWQKHTSKLFFPRASNPQVKEKPISDSSCPRCHRPASELTTFLYDTRRGPAGYEGGWLTICEKCGIQLEFHIIWEVVF